MSDTIDINVAQTVEEITINATPNLIEVNINNMNAGKHSDLILDDGTNPHGTTKTDVGLSNVPNLDTTNAVNLAHTHSNFSALNALSGTNTGDETTLSIQTKRPLKTINSTSLEGSGNIEINVDFSTHNLEELQNVTSTNYTTPIDTDSLLTFDITNLLWKRLSWLNIKSNLKTYFDGIYTTTSAVATQITTALSGYATQAWVTSQGYITNVITALGFTPENVANKSTLTTLGTSDTLYPTQNAVKTYVDTNSEKVVRAYYPAWNFTTLNTWRSWSRNTSNMVAVDANQSLGTGVTLAHSAFVDSNFILVSNKTKLKKITWSMREGGNGQSVELLVRSFTFANETARNQETNQQLLIQETFTLPLAARNGYKDNFTIATHTLTSISGLFIAFRQTSGASVIGIQGVQLILEFE